MLEYLFWENRFPAAKKGRRRKIRPVDEFFIILCQLRRGFFRETSGQPLWCGTVHCKQNVYTLDQFYVLEIWSSLYLAI